MITAKKFTRKVFENIKSNWFLPVTEHQVYSTAETKCGVWTDGKPIYRKTYILPATTRTASFSDTGISTNGLNVIKIDGVAVFDGAMRELNYSNGDTDTVMFYVHQSKLMVILKGTASNNVWYNAEWYITIYYTKTTDTAETSKVPFEPLIEYSIDEKMVGYWIDGKPIYRKTVDCGALTGAGTTKNVAHGIDNLECVIKFDGYAYNSSSGTSIPLPRVGFDNNVFVEVVANATNIIIRPKTNHSTYVRSHVTLYYTKTT